MGRRILVFLIVSFLSAPLFAQDFYDLKTIQKIELRIVDTAWRSKLVVLKESGSNDYLLADTIWINGEMFTEVGIKFKGNSSYKAEFAKNPFHIELNTFKKQNYQGYQDIKLSNGYGDPSFVREALAYHILGAYMEAPKCNFAKLYINNEYIGLYTNTESINKDFVERKFGSRNNSFVKANPILNPSPANKCNLAYKGTDSNAYVPFYELKSDNGWNDFIYLCDTLNNKPEFLEKVLDVDRAIWMLAFNAMLVNLDSYTGAFCQNYYLYKTNAGPYAPIVWDLNMAFGAFPFVGGPSNSMGSLTTSGMQQLAPDVHFNHSDWPLIQKIMANATYKKAFYAHLKTMLYNHFDTGYYKSVFSELHLLAGNELLKDSNAFFTMEQFTKAADSTIRSGSIQVPGVFQLMDARLSYLKSLSPITAVAPIISNLKSNKLRPNWNENFTITATCSLANSQTVYLYVKTNKRNSFEQVRMYDDGLHGDGIAGDMVYGANFNMSSANFYYYMMAENPNAISFEPTRAAFIYHTLQVNSPEPASSVLVINEFMASNKKSDINEYGAYEDWIELYNNGTDTLDLSGYMISDNFNNPSKFIFPIGTKINPKGYLGLWADEFPSSAKYLHTGFGLSATGEELILSNAFGALIDSISFGLQTTDKPMGRCPNGTGMFVQIEKSSFNDANIFCASGIAKNELNRASVYLYPNPSEGKFSVYYSRSEPIQVTIYDWNGRLCLSEQNPLFIDLGNLEQAYYFAVFKNGEGAVIGTQKLFKTDL